MELLNEIWQTAKRNKLRTALTGFAVAWGIFMLIVLLGAGNGLINATMQQNDRFLSNSIVVWGGTTSKPYQGLKENRKVKLNKRDFSTTENEFKKNIDEVGAQYQRSVTVSRGQQYITEAMSGVYPNHTKINKIEMLTGRFVNDIDLKERRKILIISNKHANELFEGKPYEQLLGQYVKVNVFAFQVVGIYKDQENGQAPIFTSYSAIKDIFGATDADLGRIEFTFHGAWGTSLPSDRALLAVLAVGLGSLHTMGP